MDDTTDALWPAIGIDLGTTNTVVAIWSSRKCLAKVIKIGAAREPLMPSIVAYDDAGAEQDTDFLFSTAAADDAADDASAGSNPLHHVACVKRLIGRRFDDPAVARARRFLPYECARAPDGGVAVVLDGGRGDFLGRPTVVTPVQVSARLLARAKAAADAYLARKGQDYGAGAGDGDGCREGVRSCVVTVPAYFNEAQRGATKRAAALAGLRVLQTVSEPSAAAIAYGMGVAGAKTVVVFDLGGGTFDVSVLTVDDGTFDVRAIGGDTHLGGEDVNHLLIAHFCDTRLRAQALKRAGVAERAGGKRNAKSSRDGLRNRKKKKTAAAGGASNGGSSGSSGSSSSTTTTTVDGEEGEWEFTLSRASLRRLGQACERAKVALTERTRVPVSAEGLRGTVRRRKRRKRARIDGGKEFFVDDALRQQQLAEGSGGGDDGGADDSSQSARLRAMREAERFRDGGGGGEGEGGEGEGEDETDEEGIEVSVDLDVRSFARAELERLVDASGLLARMLGTVRAVLLDAALDGALEDAGGGGGGGGDGVDCGGDDVGAGGGGDEGGEADGAAWAARGVASLAAVDEVVLVGGATRMPCVRRALRALFARAGARARVRELCTAVHPDRAVAEGAAIQAAVLAGVDPEHLRDVLMFDVLPLSIGLECADGAFEVLIPRNTRLPCEARRTFRTFEDGQPGITVEVYEGEHAVAAENKWMGYFNFPVPGGRSAKAGEKAMDVTVRMSASGILAVDAAPSGGWDVHDARECARGGWHARWSYVLLCAYCVLLFALFLWAKATFGDPEKAHNDTYAQQKGRWMAGGATVV